MMGSSGKEPLDRAAESGFGTGSSPRNLQMATMEVSVSKKFKGKRCAYCALRAKDAKALHDEGIEFSPLPVLPDERN